MVIGGIQKNSLIDYPGKISCVIFVAGCNFQCPYCHNPSLVHSHLMIPKFEIEEVFGFLDSRRDFLEGVVVSGGEPTIQPDIVPFCERIKRMGYPVKLDTNGSRPKVLEHLIRDDFVDYVAMDIKTLPDLYGAYFKGDCGPSEILSSIRLIMASGKDYEFRTTCVKPMVDAHIIEGIGRLIEGADRYVLQDFIHKEVLHPEFFRGLGPGSGCSSKELLHFNAIVKPWVKECSGPSGMEVESALIEDEKRYPRPREFRSGGFFERS